MIPNTTQIPHIIIREWMPRLGDVELRVLLIVTDQTLGWIEDVATGRRKERDWISRGQLMAKSGRGHSAVSAAIKSLVETHKVIEALDEEGNQLDSGVKRGLHGDRIYYRLSLKHPQPTLFEPVRKVDRVGISSGKRGGVSEKWPGRKVDTTKETGITKRNTLQPEKSAAPIQDKNEGKIKIVSEHKKFVDFWFNEVTSARGIKPIITGQDGRNLKRILHAGVNPTSLEQAAIYFLHNYSFKKFSPSISTFLSAGIINGLLNRMKNHPDFWKELDSYVVRRGMDPVPRDKIVYDLAELKAKYLGKMAVSLTPAEREEVSA